jgi:mRNA interferase RelE/StbE
MCLFVFKQLKNIPEKNYQKIMECIASLANNPRPPGSKKLKGRSGYRIREGNYRVIYEIMDKILTVIVIEFQAEMQFPLSCVEQYEISFENPD